MCERYKNENDSASRCHHLYEIVIPYYSLGYISNTHNNSNIDIILNGQHIFYDDGKVCNEINGTWSQINFLKKTSSLSCCENT